MKKFDHWIFCSFQVSAESLGLYRILFASLILLVVTPGHSVYAQFTLLSGFPAGFFDPPPGPMMLFGGIPGETFFRGLILMLNISLVSLLLGYKTFWASLATGLLFLTGFGFSFSLGKVNHNLLLLILPLIMMWSNWGASYSLDALRTPGKRPTAESWPLTLLILCIGFMMFTAGLPKILGGWLDPDSLATRGHLFRQFFVNGRTDLLSGWLVSVDEQWFWIMLDYVTVIFETGFLIAILHPVTARIFLALAVLFHAGTLVMMNISFTNNIIVYGAFVNWHGLLSRLGFAAVSRPGADFRLLNIQALPVIFTAGTIITLWGSPLEFLNRTVTFSSDLMFLEVVIVLSALAGVVIYYASKLVYLLRKKRAGQPLES
ncbi:MAG: HTTM domain-containing protein [Balneolales bacterium]